MLAQAEEELPLPESVQGIIAARLDTLPPDEKALVQAAAIVGKVFWPGALGELLGLSQGDVERGGPRPRTQGVRAPGAPLVGCRRDRVRLPPRARSRRRL